MGNIANPICPYCDEEVLSIHETQCYHCYTQLGNSFYPYQFATFDLRAFQEDNELSFSESVGSNTLPDRREYDIGEMPKLDETLCCNMSEEICTCAEPRSFYEGYESVQRVYLAGKAQEIADFAYDWSDTTQTGSEQLCNSCTHRGTFRCKPFREWLNWMDYNKVQSEGKIPQDSECILPCDEYLPRSSASRYQVEEVALFLQNDTHSETSGALGDLLDELDDFQVYNEAWD